MRVRAGSTMKQYGVRVLNMDGQLCCPVDMKPCNDGHCVISCWLVDHMLPDMMARCYPRKTTVSKVWGWLYFAFTNGIGWRWRIREAEAREEAQIQKEIDSSRIAYTMHRD